MAASIPILRALFRRTTDVPSPEAGQSTEAAVPRLERRPTQPARHESSKSVDDWPLRTTSTKGQPPKTLAEAKKLDDYDDDYD